MDPKLKIVYKKLVNSIEEPIREIIPAIWDLPFIEDTSYCCCGHIIVIPDTFISPNRELLTPQTIKKFWYPHKAILELYCSNESKYVQLRDNFLNDLKQISTSNNKTELKFSYSNSQLGPTPAGKRIPNTLYTTFNAEIPKEPKTKQHVEEI